MQNGNGTQQQQQPKRQAKVKVNAKVRKKAVKRVKRSDGKEALLQGLAHTLVKFDPFVEALVVNMADDQAERKEHRAVNLAISQELAAVAKSVGKQIVDAKVAKDVEVLQSKIELLAQLKGVSLR